MTNFTVNVPALEKLLDYTASGIGSVAGSMLAPWKARQEAKALAEQAQGQANAIQIIEDARNRARNELLSQPDSAHWELDVGSSISQRIRYQEEKRQRNIESVVRQAAEELEDKSVPDEEPDLDWTARFFSEVQDVSSEEMRTLWGKILAGEVERPGSTSIRTLTVLKNLTQPDAQLYSTFCGFAWNTGLMRPFIYSTDDDIYTSNGINYGALIHLESLGLIKLVDIGSLRMASLPKSLVVAYFGRRVQINFPNEKDNTLDFGRSNFTIVGLELLPICATKPVEGFFQYICSTWVSKKLELSEFMN